jgi:formylglycine-generating enzyme required for sulfatase activity
MASGSFFPWDEIVSTSQHLLLIGDIGAGKTTLGRHICYSIAKTLAQNPAPQTPEAVWPIFLPLFELESYLYSKKYADTRKTGRESPIIDFLYDYFQFLPGADFPLTFWQNLLKNYQCLIIFDGLDEISTTDHQVAIIELTDRLMADYPQLKSIITLRPEAYKPSWFNPYYRLSILLKFDQAKQEELISKLYAKVKSSLGKRLNLKPNAPERFKDLLQTPELRLRMGAPLFLTIAFLHHLFLGSEFPVGITSIHEKLIELTLYDWDKIKARTMSRRLGEEPALGQSPYKLSDELEVLSYLAWHLYQTTDSLQIFKKETTADPLIKWLVETDRSLSERQARQSVLQIIETISNRSDILTASLPKLAFRDEADVVFLAARYLADNSQSRQDFLSYLPEAQWHKLTFIVSDLLALRGPDLANDFLAFILKNAQTKPGQPYAEQILLIALCLTRLEPDLLPIKEEITQRILGILSDKLQITKLQTRIGLGRVLGKIGDPRIGEMVLVEKGTFDMGWDFFPEDRPSHKVFLNDFYIDKYPVTNSQFEAFIREGGYTKPEYWTEEGWKWVQQTQRTCPKFWHDPNYNWPNYPVVGVSWYEAAAYAKWAEKRLPTEAEWEKAARGPTGVEWPWGNEFRGDFVNSAEGEEQVGGTTPIGIYPAGASYYGALDMSGNISEWTESWYGPYPGNTKGDFPEKENSRVRRGGNWGWDHDFARCTCRVPSPPTTSYAVTGFRCCISKDQ